MTNHSHVITIFTLLHLTCENPKETQLYFLGIQEMLLLSPNPSGRSRPRLSLTNRTTVAGRAGFPVPTAEEILPAPLTLGSVCVVLAAGTVATVARGAVQFRVKVAFLRSAIAVTGCWPKR